MKDNKNDHRKSGTFQLTTMHPDIYKQSVDMQTELFKRGISWHNTFADECCADFSCCANKSVDYRIEYHLTNIKLIQSVCASEALQASNEQLRHELSSLKYSHSDLFVEKEQLRKAFEELLAEHIEVIHPWFPDEYTKNWNDKAGLPDKQTKG